MKRRNLILMVAGFVALVACSRPVAEAYTTQATTRAPQTTATTRAPAPSTTLPVVVERPEPIVITGTDFTVHTTGRVNQASIDASWVAVVDVLNRYLEAAVLTPLRTGGPAGDLTPFFTPLSVGRVTTVGPDRAAFIDEGLAPAVDLRPSRGVASLTGLVGPDGVMGLVTAQLDLRLTGLINGASLTVARAGELVLLLDGPTWRIDAWDLKVTRTLSGTTTTSAART